VQVMKRKAVAQVPSNVLKACGYLRNSAQGPTLVKVEIQSKCGKWMSFTPSDSTQWELAKMVLCAEALYVLEVFHTGIHLFASSVISSIKKALPAGTALGEMVKPQTIQVFLTMFEQATVLHSDHDSAFMGQVWSGHNPVEVWENCRDVARYFLEETPESILGITASSPTWWAGMSGSFIKPISDFAAQVADVMIELPEKHLNGLQTQLENVGLLTDPNGIQVATLPGLTKLLTNLLFVPSICHSHMYATREALTPLMGWPSTVEFLPFLRAKQLDVPLSVVLEKAFPKAPSTLFQLLGIAYATSAGYDNKKPVPQLGDGPFHLDSLGSEQSQLGDAVKTFQQALRKCRLDVYKTFGKFRNGTFVPGYFYPVDIKKPFGFGITQTSYV